MAKDYGLITEVAQAADVLAGRAVASEDGNAGRQAHAAAGLIADDIIGTFQKMRWPLNKTRAQVAAWVKQNAGLGFSDGQAWASAYQQELEAARV